MGAEGFLSLVLELNLMFLRRLIIEKSIDLTTSTLETLEATIWKMVDIFHEKVLSQGKLLRHIYVIIFTYRSKGRGIIWAIGTCQITKKKEDKLKS